MRISTALLNQRGVSGILDQQAGLSEIQKKIASGKNILTPADDPIGAAQVVRLTQTQSLTEQYQRNAEMASTRLVLEENSLAGVENTLLRVRELVLQANNSLLTDQDRIAIGQEVRERAGELLGLANTKDATGKFLFSGYQVSTKPFSQLPNGTYAYNGDQGQRQLQISSERTVADSDTGFDLFMDNLQGNGTFQVRDNPANMGAGVIDPGLVFDSAAYVADTYTISLVTNGNGNLGYNVSGAVGGQIIPPLPQDPVIDAPDFVSEQAIKFNGIETSVTGAPVAGDSFTVSPATRQDIFTMVNDLANALETRTTNNADVAKILNVTTRSILDIDQAFGHISEFHTRIGSRLNAIDSQHEVNEAFLVEIQSTLSQTQDLDLVAAISELQFRALALETAQASFARIQGLSLFNYL